MNYSQNTLLLATVLLLSTSCRVGSRLGEEVALNMDDKSVDIVRKHPLSSSGVLERKSPDVVLLNSSLPDCKRPPRDLSLSTSEQDISPRVHIPKLFRSRRSLSSPRSPSGRRSSRAVYSSRQHISIKRPPSQTIAAIAKLLHSAVAAQEIKQCEAHLEAFPRAIRQSEISQAMSLLKGFKKSFKKLRTTSTDDKHRVRGLREKVERHQRDLKYIQKVLEDRDVANSSHFFLRCVYTVSPGEIDFAKITKAIQAYPALASEITLKALGRLSGLLEDGSYNMLITNEKAVSFLQEVIKVYPQYTYLVLTIVKQTFNAVWEQTLSVQLIELLATIAASDVSYVGEVLDALNLCYTNISPTVHITAAHACLNILATHPDPIYRCVVDMEKLRTGIKGARMILKNLDTEKTVKQLAREVLKAYEVQKQDLNKYRSSRRTAAFPSRIRRGLQSARSVRP